MEVPHTQEQGFLNSGQGPSADPKAPPMGGLQRESWAGGENPEAGERKGVRKAGALQLAFRWEKQEGLLRGGHSLQTWALCEQPSLLWPCQGGEGQGLRSRHLNLNPGSALAYPCDLCA